MVQMERQPLLLMMTCVIVSAQSSTTVLATGTLFYSILKKQLHNIVCRYFYFTQDINTGKILSITYHEDHLELTQQRVGLLRLFDFGIYQIITIFSCPCNSYWSFIDITHKFPKNWMNSQEQSETK